MRIPSPRTPGNSPTWAIPRPGRRLRRGINAAVLLLGLSVLAAAACLQPNVSGRGTHTQIGLPGCLFCRLTGLPRCPSCGLTTGFAWMAHGRLNRAYRCHPFAPVFFTATLGLVLLAGASLLLDRFPWWRALPALLGLAGASLVYWVVFLAYALRPS